LPLRQRFGYFDGKAAQIFSGQASGRVPSSPRGSQGFGWDPIFVPARNEKTYAEMTGPEKNQVSMRRRAATTFVDYLDLNPIDVPTPAPDEEGTVQGSSPTRLKPLKRHVFISYCHDNQTEVRELCRYLRDAGETVWWDQDIPPGQDWELAIRKALRVSYAVIVCLSAQTTERHRSGIYPEIQDALRIYREYPPDSIFIIPVCLSPCELPAIEIDGTRMFDRLAVADLFPAERRNAGLDKLVRALRLAPEYPARGGV
jgi:hypothetical protein